MVSPAAVVALSVTVTIPKGASIGRAADILADAGVIDSAERFRRAASLLGAEVDTVAQLEEVLAKTKFDYPGGANGGSSRAS